MQTADIKHATSIHIPALLNAILIVCFLVMACNKKFDEPPVFEVPDITPDFTISELKAMHVTGQFEQLNIDKTIAGIIIADDRSGQFYKSIVIQDETGGISINLDAYDLYTKYPVGRKVYVKLKGLYLGDYNKPIQLGGAVDYSGTSPRLDAIASTLIDQFIIKGTLDNVLVPKIVTVESLNESYQNTLIQLDNYEFALADISKTFAKADLSSSAVNFTLQGCNGKSIILRNSSYADFAGYNVPDGNGSLIAVYTVFGTTKQLNIRDTSDVRFYNSRCGGGGTGAVISIAALKAFYQGSNVVLGAYKIGGIVISDAANNNISGGSMILQNENAGIKLYFGGGAATTNFNMGDSIMVDITDGTLQQYNGAMEISLPSSALPSAAIAAGKTVTPEELTIAEVTAQLPGIEYTLIKIKDATASGGVYSGNKTITDASGSMTLYTSSTATFANDALPADAKTWIGYCVELGTTKELIIRNKEDVRDDIILPPPPAGDSDLIISEYIEGSSNNKYLEIYNAAATAADLTKYAVKMYTNGSLTASSTAVLNVLTGLTSLPAGGIIVIKNSSASLTLPAAVVTYNSGVCGFNGDDAITIEKDGVVIDAFGTVGTDPGTSWTVAGNTTGAIDKTVRRNITVTKGNSSWSATSSTEWEVITTTDNVSNLGTR